MNISDFVSRVQGHSGVNYAGKTLLGLVSVISSKVLDRFSGTELKHFGTAMIASDLGSKGQSSVL